MLKSRIKLFPVLRGLRLKGFSFSSDRKDDDVAEIVKYDKNLSRKIDSDKIKLTAKEELFIERSLFAKHKSAIALFALSTFTGLYGFLKKFYILDSFFFLL